jgi:hypothetical protein
MARRPPARARKVCRDSLASLPTLILKNAMFCNPKCTKKYVFRTDHEHETDFSGGLRPGAIR